MTDLRISQRTQALLARGSTNPLLRSLIKTFASQVSTPQCIRRICEAERKCLIVLGCKPDRQVLGRVRGRAGADHLCSGVINAGLAENVGRTTDTQRYVA